MSMVFLRTPHMIDKELVTVFRRHVQVERFRFSRGHGKNKASDAELMLAGMEIEILEQKRGKLLHERELAVKRIAAEVGTGSISKA